MATKQSSIALRIGLGPLRPRVRRWLATATAVGGVALLVTPGSAAPRGDSDVLANGAWANAAGFARPDADFGAMFRWWWPPSVDASTAVSQLRQVARAGYRGVEIAMVMDGADYVVDPDAHHYGDADWRAAVKAVLAEADRLGVQVDLTLGSRWPAAIPGLDVASQAASQELVIAHATVAGGATFQGGVPAPAPRTYPDRTVEDGVVTTTTKVSPASFVRATAARCVATCAEAQPVVDLDSVADVTASVTDGRMSWTAPAGGRWIVTGYWQRGVAQRNDAPLGNTVSPLSDPESRVVNHFDSAGTTAMIRYFDGLLDQETRRLLKDNGGSIFEDSLQLKGAQPWSADFLDAFERTNGYSVRPYLPVLGMREPPSPFAPTVPVYAFAGAQSEVAERVRWDVEQTLNDLYLREHVDPIRRWAHSLGLTFRAQPYGEPIDIGAVADHLDITECESLGCSEAQFRTAATGVALARKTTVSSEMLPGGFGNLYGLTPASIVALANRDYALGANQIVFHGLPYPAIPTSADGTVTDSAAYWPGFHAFPSDIGEAFGPRQPTWTMETDVAGYYARVQRVLQTGKARYDVAVLNQALRDNATYDGTFLGAAGYTYGYVTPGSLAGQPVSHGVLAPEGPAFKAMVVDDSPMDVETAQEVARVARAGLTVIVVGGGPRRTLGYATSADAAAGLDGAVRRTFDQIARYPTVSVVANSAAVPDVLAARRVTADAQLTDGVTTVHRKEGTRDFYFLHNAGAETVTTSATLLGEHGAVPYVMDPWSGHVTTVGVHTGPSRRATVDFTLPPGGAMIVGLAHGGAGGADEVETIGAVPLTKWDLTLDEWLPGTPGEASSVTRHRFHTVRDVPPAPWSQIAGMEDAVGVGTYTSTLTAPTDLRDVRLRLDLGDVSGSYRVYVNGRAAPVADQLGAVADLGRLVRPGRNSIEVRVASTLLNRLRLHRPAEFGDRHRTVNGLLGPVTLRSYRVRLIASDRPPSTTS